MLIGSANLVTSYFVMRMDGDGWVDRPIVEWVEDEILIGGAHPTDRLTAKV